MKITKKHKKQLIKYISFYIKHLNIMYNDKKVYLDFDDCMTLSIILLTFLEFLE